MKKIINYSKKLGSNHKRRRIMISVLTVELKSCKNHLELLLNSIINHSKFVSEVIIAVSDATEDFKEEWKVNNIQFKRFSNPIKNMWYGHALGLHAALDHAQGEYIMFSDPDTFWYTPLDEFYLKLINNHDLNYIGVSHHNGINQCFGFFPYVINSMVKKSSLPNKNWLQGKLKFRGVKLRRAELLENELFVAPSEADAPLADGKFLIPNPIPDLCDTYPNKDSNALFDVGCNMWLWNEEKKGRWLSFQTIDCHIYATKYFKNNFGLKEKLPKKNLIYHLGSGSRGSEEDLTVFKKAYKDSVLLT
jgi:glycosyltransferase involved in cell wall biosynthesis